MSRYEVSNSKDIANLKESLDTTNTNVNNVGNLAQQQINLINTNQVAKQSDLDAATAQLAQKAIKPNAIAASNVLALSESIMGAGNFIPQFQAEFNPQPTVLQSIYGGSHIATALAEMADEFWIPQNGENIFKYSNDLTQSVWTKDDVTVTRQYMPDGSIWNQVIKPDSNTYKGFFQSIPPYPTGATGLFVSCEVFIPTTSNPAPMTKFYFGIADRTTNSGGISIQSPTLIPGNTYKVCGWFDKSQISWVPGSSDNFTIEIYPNQNATPTPFAPCTAYFRNFQANWFAPSFYSEYVPTGASNVAAGTTTLSKINKNKYAYKGLDSIIISFGRNEANDGVSAYSHYRAYDKLISVCLQKAKSVVIGNPPPYLNGTTYDTADDMYMSQPDNRFDLYWKQLMQKWNNGVDVHQNFLDLVAAGTYTPSQLNTDSWHPANTGGLVMAGLYSTEIKNRPLPNNSNPELQNTIKYYPIGTPTGSWSLLKSNFGLEQRLFGMDQSISAVSSTQNDYLLFTNITAEQLHIIFRQDISYGSFVVIVDEGTPQERDFTINSATQTDRVHGQFLCDLLGSSTHTVKIKVTSNGLPVKIHGIVAI